ncbi:MAG: DUF5941 domain-containing protein [Sporichthyaceae bacterium]
MSAGTLVVLADSVEVDGRAAALLPAGDGRVLLRRLVGDAVGLGLTPGVLLTRRQWVDEVEACIGGQLTTVGYVGTAGVLASLAAQLDRLSGPVVLAHAEVMVHPDLLADLVADPRLGTAVLVGAATPGRLRVSEGQVLGAGSERHELSGAGHLGLGVLRVADGDRAAMAAAARDLSGLVMVHGWDTDALDLLTMAAVRRGIVVGTVDVGGYVWGRPQNCEQAERTARRIAAQDAHRVRLERVARPDDGFYSTFVVRRISRLVTSTLVRTQVGSRVVTPNQVTLIAFVIALAAAVAFANGGRGALIAGALLLQVSLVLDCVDGEIARYTRRFSPFGAWLDLTTDRIKEYAVYAGLAIGSARAGDEVWTLAAATLALQVFRNFVDFGFVTTVDIRRAARRGEQVPLDRTIDPGGGAPPAREAVAGLGRNAVGHSAMALSERTSSSPWLKWGKRMVFLPIGERWLLISLAAALSGAAAVFWVLLVLGSVSAVYATAGRVLRALALAPVPGRRSGPERFATGELEQIADFGLLASLLWKGRLGGRFGWLLPGLVRAIEYTLVVVLVAAVDSAAVAAAFAYLAALAYHHYDTVYRWRHTGAGPPRWVFAAALGVEGRILALLALVALCEGLSTPLTILAIAAGGLFALESGFDWYRRLRAQPAPAPTHTA